MSLHHHNLKTFFKVLGPQHGPLAEMELDMLLVEYMEAAVAQIEVIMHSMNIEYNDEAWVTAKEIVQEMRKEIKERKPQPKPPKASS